MSINSMAYNPLADNFVAAPPKPRAELVMVDPTLAGVWMLRNTANRRLDEAVVRRYAADMQAGEWIVTGNGPRFSREGQLLDGQHTLKAILRAEIEQELFVFWNLSAHAQRNCDDGRKRTYSDHLQIGGASNSTALASVTRRVLLFERGSFGPSSPAAEPTKAQLDTFLAAHPRLHTSALMGAAIGRALTMSAAVVGTAHYVFAGIDAAAADDFLLQLKEGASLAAGSPILTLRERLLRARQDRITTNSMEVLAWFMRAWDAYRLRKPLKIVRFGSAEQFPLPKDYRPSTMTPSVVDLAHVPTPPIDTRQGLM